MKTSHKNKGAALLELVMAMAFFAFLFVAIFFFGWAMVNQQHVKEAARYVSWRWVADHENDPNNVSPWNDPNQPGLNEMFFRSESAGFSVNYFDGDDIEFDELVQAAESRSNYAGSFSNALLLDPPVGYNHFAHAVGAEVGSSFNSDIDYFKQFSGDIVSHHIRDGVEWRWHQADIRHVTRIQFLQSLDDQLKSIPGPGAAMGEMIRGLYLRGWGDSPMNTGM